jgi:DNA-binding PadR family transcriptional regulator
MSIERVTLPLLMVVAVLRDRPNKEHHGYAIAKETALTGARVHQILVRLEAEDWLTSRREDIDPKEAGRPPRRLYKLTAPGIEAAEQLFAAHGHRLHAPAVLGWEDRLRGPAVRGGEA